MTAAERTTKRKAERALISAMRPHGEPGHLNISVRDQDSDVTGYGQHNRLLLFKPIGCEIYEVREDRLWGLPDSTEDDRQRVLKGWQRLHPQGTRLRLIRSTDLGNSIWHDYAVESTKPRNRR